MRRLMPVVLLAAFSAGVHAQSAAAPDPPWRDWKAGWITHPTAPLREPIVLHFRRSLKLGAAPASYVARVSADNRFILYVNGRRVGDGPARGDLDHWRYERFDLAPFLKTGDNLITATVWNFGVYAPVAQMSDRTAFLLESEAGGDEDASTPKGWQVEIEQGQKPLPRVPNGFWPYMAQGPGEELDAAKYDWDWQSPDDKGGGWVEAASPIRESVYSTTNRAHSADGTADNPWGLVPDGLPKMAYSPVDAGVMVDSSTASAIGSSGSVDPDSDVVGIADGKLEPNGLSVESFKLPQKSIIHIMLDRKTLTTAYPQLTVSGGKGASIRLTYSEALYDKDQHKGDRDAVKGRVALGLSDLFRPDGGEHRTFEPLWWRTWRYLDLDITTGDQPLTLESLKAEFTAYPFDERAKFETGDADLDKIWEISWRTARLDSHETYMDTPYYEQLQYVGDTRIQALISYTVAGDDRLARQALEAFNDSRIPEGITRSRYPSSLPQNIPTFSLLWIGMLHDWWMYRPDPAPIRESLEGTRAVLKWFAQYEQPDGLLKKTPWWSFIDWVQDKQEIPTYSANGESCVTTLEYLGALNDAADLEKALGDPHIAEQHRERAEHVRDGIYKNCWNSQKGMVADNPDHKNFSQQANILGVLYDVVPSVEQRELLRRMLTIEPGTTPDGVLSASYYFRFYLARALDHAGMADEYLGSLKPWRDLLPLHFSTWPETPGETRSDSHAWSAHPIYDLLTLVAGIEPESPGFATVRIAPHLGNLRSLSATFPHPKGNIRVEYRWTPEHANPGMMGGSTFHATVTLPDNLTGTFEFGGMSRPLMPGVNQLEFPMR
ncbi:MAG TPA: alpha-L-rhamnosidase C-terminal domain-containing protein [Terracidiphilus sp.]|nr:alpha-L-rhamnosidase C-terminal domain-containing protein [Terracidiphilus sp.]